MSTSHRFPTEYLSTIRRISRGILNGLALACALALGLVQTWAPAGAQSQPVTTVTVETGSVLRQLPARHHMGHNFNFQELAFDSFDPVLEELHPAVYDALKEARPGILRFPAGNQSYGYHFALAREGTAHRVSNAMEQMDFRPQHLLQLIADLRADGVELDLLVHLSAVWASPEEAAAFVAYLTGDPADSREIGIEGRDYSGRDWLTVGHWANLRQNVDGLAAYSGTLHYQVGNEEWQGWCGSGNCSGWTDAYGLRRTQRMTIRRDPQGNRCKSRNVRKRVKVSYLDAYGGTYRKLKALYGSAVKVGAAAVRNMTGNPTYRSGADIRCGFKDGWNESLLAELDGNPQVGADFIGSIHLYGHDKDGWQLHDEAQGSHNLLGAADQFNERVANFNELSLAETGRTLSELVGPGAIWVTEFNAHQHPSAANPVVPQSSLVQALYNLDLVAGAMANPDVGALLRWQAARSDVEGNGNYEYALLHTPHPNPFGEVGRSGPFYAYSLLGRLDRAVLATAVESCAGCDWTPVIANSWYSERPLSFVSALATLSDDGEELSVLLINKHTTDDMAVDLTLLGYLPANAYSRTVLDVFADNGHGSIFAENLLGAPERLGFTEDAALALGACDRMTVTLPNHSATLLRFSRGFAGCTNPLPPDPEPEPAPEPVPDPATLLFEEAFNDLNRWSKGGRRKWFNRAMHDPAGYDFAAGSGNKIAEALGGGFYGPSTLTSNTIDTSGYGEVVIAFQRYLAGALDDPLLDYLELEAKASDGWHTLRHWGPGNGADGNWSGESVTLTAADGAFAWSGFRVRFGYRGGGGTDYVGVDDVTVSAR